MPEPLAPKASVLLVDDQPANLLALRVALEELDQNLVEARSGEEALRRLREADFAVVLLDVQMPGQDGFETAKLIRAQQGATRTPIIFLTAYDDGRFPVEQAYSLGAVDYLVKPLIPVILRAKVAGFVELFNKTQQVQQQAERLRQAERREFGERLAQENARLQESERRFRALASHAPVGIFETDARGNCLFVNERWCELAGLSPQEAEGQGWARALHPEDHDRVFREWYSAAQAGQEFASEYRFLTPQGKSSWLEGRAVALRDGAGEIIGYLGTVTDVTARKEALALLDTLQNNAPVGFAFVDREFRYVRINEALAAINGAKPADHLGRTVRELVPQLWPQLEPLYRGILEGGQPLVNLEITGETPAAPGATRHWLVNYYPVRIDQQVAGIGIIVTDITERKRLENELRRRAEQLHESEQRFSRFMQYLPGLAWIKDLQGRYLYANDAAIKAFRSTPEALLGRVDEEVFPPETARQFRENDRQALTSGGGVQVVETLEHEDGVLHHSIVSKFPITGPDGTPSLVGGMAIDITGRMKAEEALREADRLKDEFLAMLAHELRNPLAPVRNALEIMRQPNADAAMLRQARTIAERQVRHMARLLDDLLDVSRISRGRIELRKEAVDVASAIGRTAEAVRALFEDRRHELTVALPAGPLRVEADPARLEQVLTNLLNNAAKYTDPGGRVWVSAERDGTDAVLRVRDTGVGIAPEMLTRVFDLFVQAERRLDRSHGGIGIGLTLVKRLVELHGGSVEAHSPGPGQGSEFVIRLPALVEQRQGERDAGPDEEAAPELPRRRVLVVDDSPDAADSLALLLRLDGQDVRVAYSGPAALAQAGQFHPEVVFLDIGMPGMDGYEVARRLRAGSGLGGAVLVAVTGWGQEEDRRRSSEAGFNHHLVKPVEPKALEALLVGLGPANGEER
jgi:PAS domain S-box-containing protein